MKNINIEEIYTKILNNELTTQHDWNNLIRNYELTEEIIEEFADKWNWHFIAQKQHLSKKFILKHMRRFLRTTFDDATLVVLCKQQSINEKFIDKYLMKHINVYIWNFDDIIELKHLSKEFIQKWKLK